MLEKPWERKGQTEVLADAITDQTHTPWHPKPAKVPRAITAAHRQKVDLCERKQAPPLSVFKRQEFAKAFLIDCDPTMACIRIGITDDIDHARKEGWRIYREPLTLAAIQAFSARMEEDKIVSRERVLAGLYEEANYRGMGSSHSARVAAWARMAVIIGADKPKDAIDPNKQARGGVMLIPHMDSIDQWESAATGSQAALKAAVRQ